MNIKRIPSPNGLRSVLTYWYRGVRYRPVLGYGLTRDHEHQQAIAMIKEIQEAADRPPDVDRMTFAEFVPLYQKRLEVKHRTVPRRNLSVIENHLLPHFGAMKLKDIRLHDGDGYILKRRNEGAADGTTARECSVLSAILNYAVDADYLDKNRLKHMAVPQGAKRTRVATKEDLDRLYPVCFSELWRAMIVALNTGLREQRIVDIDQSWIVNAEDGPWLHLPAARTKHKGNPDRIPLNSLAAEALRLDVTYLHGRRIFDNWHDGEVLGAIFRRKVQKANITDLHFHDLRHTFSTVLENLGVDTRTIDLLMGHKLPGMGEHYRHGGAGRDKTLRDAVTKLDKFWRSVPLQVPLGSPARKLPAVNR